MSITETERSIEPVPDRLGVLATWLPRVALALVFLEVGSSKFRDPMWVRLFDQIGLGQWFRKVTGIMQLTAGLLVLVPTTALVGIALAACTMAGAVVVWITVLHAPANAPIPGILLAILLVVGFREYRRSR
jgi:uncharacterized membrane protein YphA (DoxX/SURF4 family)